MYKFCKNEQSSQRQRELEQGLLTMMEHRQFDEISVSDLCERMNIPRKSFYRYFSSKEGALHALIDYTLMDFDSFTENWMKSDDSTQEELERMFAYWYHKKDFLDALAKSNLSGVLVQRAIGHSTLETIQYRRFLPLEEQHAQEYCMLFAVTGLMSMVIQWHRDGYPQTPRQMAQIAMHLVTHLTQSKQ